MRRLKNFFLGLFIIVVVGTLLFMYLDISQIKRYQQELLKYNWFEPTLIACAGVLIFFGILMFFIAPVVYLPKAHAILHGSISANSELSSCD